MIARDTSILGQSPITKQVNLNKVATTANLIQKAEVPPPALPQGFDDPFMKNDYIPWNKTVIKEHQPMRATIYGKQGGPKPKQKNEQPPINQPVLSKTVARAPTPPWAEAFRSRKREDEVILEQMKNTSIEMMNEGSRNSNVMPWYSFDGGSSKTLE